MAVAVAVARTIKQLLLLRVEMVAAGHQQRIMVALELQELLTVVAVVAAAATVQAAQADQALLLFLTQVRNEAQAVQLHHRAVIPSTHLHPAVHLRLN